MIDQLDFCHRLQFDPFALSLGQSTQSLQAATPPHTTRASVLTSGF